MGNKLLRWVVVKDNFIFKYKDYVVEKLREIFIYNDESSCISVSYLCFFLDGMIFWVSDCDGCLIYLDKEGNVLIYVLIVRSDGGFFIVIIGCLVVMYVDFYDKVVYKFCIDMFIEILVSMGDWNLIVILLFCFVVCYDESLFVGMRKGYFCKIIRYSKDGKLV